MVDGEPDCEKCIEVSKYPRNPDRQETVPWYSHDDVALSYLLAYRGERLNGWGVIDRPWRSLAEEGAMERFNELVDKYLGRLRGHTPEDLHDWSIDRLYRELSEAIGEETEAINKQTRAELEEAFQAGHDPEIRAHWQSQTREAVLRLRHYRDALRDGKSIEQAPLPFMEPTPTSHMAARGHEPPIRIPKGHCRKPLPEDTPWRCLCLGLKLEALFQEEELFVPKDVRLALVELADFIEDAVYMYIDGNTCVCASATRDDLKKWWLFIKQDLLGRGLILDAGAGEANGAIYSHPPQVTNARSAQYGGLASRQRLRSASCGNLQFRWMDTDDAQLQDSANRVAAIIRDDRYREQLLRWSGELTKERWPFCQGAYVRVQWEMPQDRPAIVLIVAAFYHVCGSGRRILDTAAEDLCENLPWTSFRFVDVIPMIEEIVQDLPRHPLPNEDRAKSRRGPKPRLSPEAIRAREVLISKWEQARSTGISCKEFCRDYGSFEGKPLNPVNLNAIRTYLKKPRK